MQRQAIQPAAFCTQMMPVQKRATMLAATARMLPVPICGLVRLSEVFFFMYTISGAAANMEKNEEKKP